MNARYVVALLLLLCMPASAAVPASVHFLGRRATDPATPCINSDEYYNTASNTERCCASTAWKACGSAVVTGAGDTAVMFVHPASTVATDVANFSYATGTGQLSLVGPTAPGAFVSAGSGGTALAMSDYVDPATGISRLMGSGAGLQTVYVGAATCGSAVSLRTCDLESLQIRGDRVVQFPQPVSITSTDVKTSCVLNGGTPATCTATVSTVHACVPFCTLAAPGVTTPGCVRVGTTITATAGTGDTQTVNILCL